MRLIRPVNLGALGRPFLGQEEAGNRLLDLPVNVILQRNVVTPPVEPRYPSATQCDSRGCRVPQDAIWAYYVARQAYKDALAARQSLADAGYLSVLEAVMSAPTPEEAEDLAIIERFFELAPPGEPAATQCDSRGCRVPQEAMNTYWAARAAYAESAFVPYTYIRDPRAPDFYQVSSSELWGDVRRSVYNAAVFSATARAYPFPPPIPLFPTVWWGENRGDIAKLVNSDIVLTPPLVRMWMTAATLGTYERVSAVIVDYLEERAEEEKKRMYIRVAVLAVGGIVAGAVLGAALAPLIPAGFPVTASQISGTVVSQLQKTYTEQELDKMASDMEETALLFQTTAPLFAEEVRKLQDTLEFLAGRAAESAETAAARAELENNPFPNPGEVGVNLDYYSPGPSKALVGAAAGVGLAGLLFLVLR